MSNWRDELGGLIAQHYISVKDHPTLPLALYSYTAKAQAKRHWTEATEICRGVVLDHRLDFVSRPFRKFHHWNQIELPVDSPRAYGKLDGSLIVVSRYQGKRIISSRNSFTSPHVALANSILGDWQPDRGYTYCFELISPRHRIIINYDHLETLVLLAKIETATGREIPLEYVTDWTPTVLEREISWPLQSPDQYDRGNQEGLILIWPQHNYLRAKVKFSEYVRLHGLLTGVSAHQIWEVLACGRDLEIYRQNVPDEFLTWVDAQIAELRARYNTLLTATVADYQRIVDDCKTRRDFALAINDHPYRGALWLLYDDKDPTRALWEYVKPEKSRPYWNDKDAA